MGWLLEEAVVLLKVVKVVVGVPIGMKVDRDRSERLLEAVLVLGKLLMVEADCTSE